MTTSTNKFYTIIDSNNPREYVYLLNLKDIYEFIKLGNRLAIISIDYDAIGLNFYFNTKNGIWMTNRYIILEAMDLHNIKVFQMYLERHISQNPNLFNLYINDASKYNRLELLTYLNIKGYNVITNMTILNAIIYSNIDILEFIIKFKDRCGNIKVYDYGSNTYSNYNIDYIIGNCIIHNKEDILNWLKTNYLIPIDSISRYDKYFRYNHNIVSWFRNNIK